MFRILRSVLLLTLAALLWGCQAAAPSQSFTTETPGENLYAIVNLSVNPELEIHVDRENCVRHIFCKNDDARAAAEGLEYDGLPFELYLQSFLDRCMELDYLKDGTDIRLKFEGEVTPQQGQLLQQQADAVLTKCAAEGNIHLTSQMELPGQEVAVFSYVATYVSPNAQKEYDAQGNLTGYREIMEDGTVVEAVLDAAGHIAKETVTGPDGSYFVTVYDSQGNVISIQEKYADGTENEFLRDALGNTVQTKRLEADGSGWLITFNSQNLQQLREEYGPGRTVLFQTSRVYHSTDPIQYTETDSNGFVRECLCDAQGRLLHTRSESQGPMGTLISEEWYDASTAEPLRRLITEPDGVTLDTAFENGIQISELRLQPDGVRMEREFQNGVPVIDRWEAPDGEVWQDIYTDGEITEAKGTMADGSVWSRQYAGGSMVYFRRDAPDGSYWEERYSGGNRVYEASYNAALNTGSANTYTYNPNGTVAFIYTVNADGSIYEETHDSNGNAISWKITDTSGAVTAGTFSD